jgi:hypothetical protein
VFAAGCPAVASSPGGQERLPWHSPTNLVHFEPRDGPHDLTLLPTHRRRFTLCDGDGKPVAFAVGQLSTTPLSLCSDSAGRVQIQAVGDPGNEGGEPQAVIVQPSLQVLLVLPEPAVAVRGRPLGRESGHLAGDWWGDMLLMRWPANRERVDIALASRRDVTITRSLIESRGRPTGPVRTYACSASPRRVAVFARGADGRLLREGVWIWVTPIGDAETGGIWLDLERDPSRANLDTGALSFVAHGDADYACLLAHPEHLIAHLRVPQRPESGEAIVELALTPGAPLAVQLPGNVAGMATLEVTLTRDSRPYAFVSGKPGILAPDGENVRFPFALPPGRFVLSVKAGTTVWRADFEVHGTLPVDVGVR